MTAGATTTEAPNEGRKTAAQAVSIKSLTLEVPDPAAAKVFYTAAFDLGDRLRL